MTVLIEIISAIVVMGFIFLIAYSIAKFLCEMRGIL